MDFQQAKELDSNYIIHSYGRFPLLLTKGKGAQVQDDTGKTYIDFTSGIGVNALGFCDDGWVQAVGAQLASLQHTSNLYYTEPCIQTAKLLCEKSGMKKVFFGNSGAEANEGVIKAARKYSFEKYGEGRNTILALKNSFHGRTMAALSATGQDAYHNYFFPFVEGFAFAKANDLEDTLAKMTPDVCALMLETIQGEGGVVPLDKEYVQAVAKACQEKDILLIVDEVQTGMGRTGTLFSYQQFDIQPDLVSCAKGLGGGLPIGAVLFGEKTETVFGAGDHGSTFGGNPVVCAGAVHILQTMDDAFLQSVAEKGAYLKEKIANMPHVQNVTGLGMMLGILLDTEAKPVIHTLLEKGLLVLSAKEKIRLLPPLTITKEEMDQGLAILEETLNAL
ncbi:aspartate aminotransferase family protein [Anaerotignum lactatifermentans]|uniref:Acetylornithine aminotransferase n=1 Tax=Anaerotignum lactatifermentans TaxID=160404 RepID=A0ABS2G9W6_9FIRM|nr:aspartate aminotransferase family protein [Anaerotignum lactatifermentans]MBM6829035.1 aspartate aminotransferase family protein [Anaerotignum lactatifermentans]MBM6877358.1 aspartate aminotransferase family protein [Anaerotignum lactatifermentans]MBM6950728.1 aspartate aminotransferase family protein [Anaerotignum lactatifermentans]